MRDLVEAFTAWLGAVLMILASMFVCGLIIGTTVGGFFYVLSYVLS